MGFINYGAATAAHSTKVLVRKMRLLILGFLILFVASGSCHQVPPVSSQLLGLLVNESYGERSEQLEDFQDSLGDFLDSFHSRKNGFGLNMLNQLSF